MRNPPKVVSWVVVNESVSESVAFVSMSKWGSKKEEEGEYSEEEMGQW